MLSPLQLEDFWIESLEMTCDPSLRESAARANQSISLLIGVKDRLNTKSDGSFQKLLTVQAEGASRTGKDDDPVGSPNFKLKVVLAGEFRMIGDVPQDRQKLLRDSNAPAMLYGVLRGLVTQFSSFTPYGKLNLPTVNFTAIQAGGEGKIMGQRGIRPPTLPSPKKPRKKA